MLAYAGVDGSERGCETHIDVPLEREPPGEQLAETLTGLAAVAPLMGDS
jgi:hypothetical protein